MPPAVTHRSTPAPRRALMRALLAWYDAHARVLPWRARAGEPRDPYRVWLSEIMLQQTTVATVGPYFRRFVERWPDVASLAAAPLDDVLAAWGGLGYYARARNLHRCAQLVVGEHRGRFPDTEAALRALPGIGTYTAAAIAAIAFDRMAVPVDGNVERVMARLQAIETPLPAAKPALRAAASALAPGQRPGDFAQALMDLGATVCAPRKPDCPACPWRGFCRARALGLEDVLPRRTPRRARKRCRAIAFALFRRGRNGVPDAVWLRRRDGTGVLGGMMELPSTPWPDGVPDAAERQRAAPARVRWRLTAGAVRHVFTHLELELELRIAFGEPGEGAAGAWCRLDALDAHALPTLTRKAIRHALAEGV